MSVVLPTYRRPDYLERAVRSVQRQTHDDWELLVVDDNVPGSLDRRATEPLVESLSVDPRIRYLRHDENRGGSAARNTGIQAATGSFVAFLDDDDEWHPEKLERQLQCIDNAPPDVALVYCRIVDMEGGQERVALHTTKGHAHTKRDLLIRNSIGTTSCVLCRRSALEEVGGFDERLEARQDIDLYVRLAEHFTFAFVNAQLVIRHRQPHGSISSNFDASIRAHKMFFEKHHAAIEADPTILHARLSSLGTLLIDAKRFVEARAVLLRAWRIRPTDRVVIVRLAMSFGAFRTLGASTKRVFTAQLGSRGRLR